MLARSPVPPLAGVKLLVIEIRAQKHAALGVEPLRGVFHRKRIPGDAGSVCTAHILVYFHRNAENPRNLRGLCVGSPSVYARASAYDMTNKHPPVAVSLSG